MKAAVLKGIQNIEVTESPKPNPTPYEVVVKVKACGICGTDHHIYHGKPGSAKVQPPITLGHELSGVVAEIGDHVTTLKKGDRVTIDPNLYCGHCEFCRSGRPQLCDHLQAVGVTRDGGMGEYCSVPAITVTSFRTNCLLKKER